MYCTNCGFKLEEDAKFCSNCGMKVEDLETPQPPAGQQVAAPAENAVSADMASVSPDAGETTVLPGADATTVLPTANEELPQPPAPDEPPVDMTHAFDPQPAPATTMQMPVIDTPEPARRYDGIPPEEIVGKPAKPKKKLSGGAIAGIVIGAVVIVAAIAVCLFLFVFSGDKESTVSFETAGGSTIEAIQVPEGESINSPANPVKDGYSFDGWYADPSFSTPVTFPLSPSEDMTLYAKWVPMVSGNDTSAGSTSETYTTDDQARAALKGYLTSLEDADEVVHDFATDDFNKKFNKGTSKVLECLEDCSDARQDVYELLADASGAQWRVSTLSIPETYSEERAMLEEASDTLITRLNAYENALHVISNMGPNASSKEIDAAIEGYLNDGHVAYEDYKSIVKKLKSNL